MDSTRTTSTPPPRELITLRSATQTYLSMIRDCDQWAEQVADVNRIIRPDYAGHLDSLRDEFHEAMKDKEMGTPARIGLVVAEMLGEA